MPARYLIRFDDICPTMNWEMWSRIESVLRDHQLNPLLAVIPDNQDNKLNFGAARPSFWDEVRRWQGLGWTIGLHGYQHRFVTGQSGIVGIQRRSEFAGVPAWEQDEKLLRAVEIFRVNGVRPDVWIAPAHSFDWNTVAALQKLGITTINDGFAIAPHTDSRGLLWIPQQLWKFRWRPLESGRFAITTIAGRTNSSPSFRMTSLNAAILLGILRESARNIASGGALCWTALMLLPTPRHCPGEPRSSCRPHHENRITCRAHRCSSSYCRAHTAGAEDHLRPGLASRRWDGAASIGVAAPP